MWRENWPDIHDALIRDAGLPAKWSIQPWIFVPEKFVAEIKPTLERLYGSEYRFNKLEDSLPWNYAWDRGDDDASS